MESNDRASSAGAGPGQEDNREPMRLKSVEERRHWLVPGTAVKDCGDALPELWANGESTGPLLVRSLVSYHGNSELLVCWCKKSRLWSYLTSSYMMSAPPLPMIGGYPTLSLKYQRCILETRATTVLNGQVLG